MILWQEEAQQRSRMWTIFVSLADILLRLGNFTAVFAIGIAIPGNMGAAPCEMGSVPCGMMSSARDRPPPNSKPIDQTPWSGDHGKIKGGLGLGGEGVVVIDPSDNVWVQHPDGSWSNEGPAGNFTGSGEPSGRRGKDRNGH